MEDALRTERTAISLELGQPNHILCGDGNKLLLCCRGYNSSLFRNHVMPAISFQLPYLFTLWLLCTLILKGQFRVIALTLLVYKFRHLEASQQPSLLQFLPACSQLSLSLLSLLSHSLTSAILAVPQDAISWPTFPSPASIPHLNSPLVCTVIDLKKNSSLVSCLKYPNAIH